MLPTTWVGPVVLSMDTSWTGLLMVSYGFQFQTNSVVDVIIDSLFKYITFVLYEINVIGCTEKKETQKTQIIPLLHRET